MRISLSRLLLTFLGAFKLTVNTPTKKPRNPLAFGKAVIREGFDAQLRSRLLHYFSINEPMSSSLMPSARIDPVINLSKEGAWPRVAVEIE